MKLILTTPLILTMLSRSALAFRSAVAFNTRRAISSSALLNAKDGQAEVVLVGCGAPNRGMGWYHALQMLEDR